MTIKPTKFQEHTHLKPLLKELKQEGLSLSRKFSTTSPFKIGSKYRDHSATNIIITTKSHNLLILILIQKYQMLYRSLMKIIWILWYWHRTRRVRCKGWSICMISLLSWLIIIKVRLISFRSTLVSMSWETFLIAQRIKIWLEHNTLKHFLRSSKS